MKFSTNKLLIFLTIAVVATLLFVPFLGKVHLFDWDEINFAEAAREMIRSGNYLSVQIDYHPFWEKPPLFIWMQVVSMKLFGINEFAARFPNALCGIFTCLILFHVGNKIRDKKLGLTWVMVYTCSILPFFYFKSGIIDPWFNLFIFISIYYSFRFVLEQKQSAKYIYISLAAVFMGLAILTKGPVALLIYLLTFGIYIIIKMFHIRIKFLQFLLFFGILLLVGGFWFILQLTTGHYELMKEFVQYQIRLFQTKDAGHGGFLLYHFVILFLGVFPASIFAIRSFRLEKKEDREPIHEFKNWMMILFWTVLILFTIVKTKIVHYSSICYFPLTFLASYVIIKLIEQKQQIPKWINRLLITVSIIWGMIIILLQLIAKYKSNIISSNIIQDPFAAGNLQSSVYWSGKEWLIGACFIFLILIFITLKGLSTKLRVIGIFSSTLLFTYATVLIITPKIEGYSQRAAIEFYKEKSKENCYVQQLGFKSYAQLFYFNKGILKDSRAYDEQWLLKGHIDKPVYFIMKCTVADSYLSTYPQLKKIGIKNGFVFAKRDTIQ